MSTGDSASGPVRRAGRARGRVLDELVAGLGPITAEDLAARLPEVHVSSVYRALAVLEEEGVVAHVHLGHGPAVYQLAEEADAVRHLVCDVCGLDVVVPSGVFSPLRRRLERDYGFVLDADHFAVVGRCVACARATRRHPG
jgi:Fur family transcriptional regulator, ferric uptake regulator